MLKLLLLLIGLAVMATGSAANLGFVIAGFHVGFGSVGLTLVLLALGAWLREIFNTLGPIPFTMLILLFSGGVIYLLTIFGLGPQIIPKVELNYGGSPTSPYTYGSGTNSTLTTPSNSTSLNPAPSGLPAFPKDPFGLVSWTAGIGPLATTILEAAFAIMVAIVAAAIFLRIHNER